ncbi:Uncharacterized protein OBRU01_05246 [Operophtera brumata]|uniref:CCHC-type domain-containing protein n=1 Tax=Operophtera brumata TaxID=104452 RepID=A0A0L7LMY1_OPEBR|nr:Uncharacterized protein OBRU01_05246 [Operophtera brumata]
MGIGKITEFNVRSGNWNSYVERVEMYFKVNSIKEELWLPTLIAAMASGSASADVLHAGVAWRGRGAPARGGARPPSRSRDKHSYGGGGNNAVSCHVCGASDHRSDDCRYKRFICGKCRQRGHLRRVCPLRSGARERRATDDLVAHVQAGGGSREVDLASGSMLSGDDESPHSDDEWGAEEDLHQLCLNGYKPVRLPLCIDGTKIPMEIDTGSLVSCISKMTYDKYFSNRPLEGSNLVFKFYNGAKIRPVGVFRPAVSYGSESKLLELFVIEGGTTSLLGRQWISELKIRMPKMYSNIVCNEKI